MYVYRNLDVHLKKIEINNDHKMLLSGDLSPYALRGKQADATIGYKKIKKR